MSHESGAFILLVDDKAESAAVGDLALKARGAASGQRVELITVCPVNGTTGIEQTRAALAQASLSAAPGATKLVLFENADTLTLEAQNSLLKKLEDAPEGTIFVLATRNPYSLLPTVRSRCQFIDMRESDGIAGAKDEAAQSALDLLSQGEARALCVVSRMSQGEGLALIESLARVFEQAMNRQPETAVQGLWIALCAYNELKDNANPGLCLEAMISRLFELSGLEGLMCQ